MVVFHIWRSDPSTHLFITRRLVGKCDCDWLIDDVDDPIGCWQVFLNDGVESAGVVHQDEPLHQPEIISVFMWT